jgi:zinc protease
MTASLRPSPGAPRSYHFPRTVDRRLQNGLTVICAPLRRLPAVTVLFTADAGAEHDPVEQAGVGALSAQALGEGTSSRTANDIAGAFERLGGELQTDASWSHAECGTTVLAAHLPECLSLLAEVVHSPRFPEEGVLRLRQERLADLLQQRAEPRGLADDLFAECCFAAGDRYALPSGGSEGTVEALTPEIVRAHYTARYAPPSGLLIIAGDVDADEAIRWADQAFGAWSSAVVPSRDEARITPRSSRAVHIGHRPEAPQTEIRIGHASVPRTHPDFYALSVMNAILGGLFNSRINLNLREAHGYTYGAFSGFDWRCSGSVFEVSTAVKSEVTAAAVSEIMREIEHMRAQRVREDELSLARDYLTGVFPLRFETTAAIADAIALRHSYGLAPAYYDEFRSRIAAIQLDDVHRVANEHLRPERMQIVVVGDAALITEPLDALGLGEVRKVDTIP